MLIQRRRILLRGQRIIQNSGVLLSERLHEDRPNPSNRVIYSSKFVSRVEAEDRTREGWIRASQRESSEKRWTGKRCVHPIFNVTRIPPRSPNRLERRIPRFTAHLFPLIYKLPFDLPASALSRQTRPFSSFNRGDSLEGTASRYTVSRAVARRRNGPEILHANYAGNESTASKVTVIE